MNSREKGMKRRRGNEELTTSSQKETTNEQKIRVSFNSKDSERYFFMKNEDCMKDNDTHIAAAGRKRTRKYGSNEGTEMQEKKIGRQKEEVEGSSSSMHSPPSAKEERQVTTTFTVLQKTRGRCARAKDLKSCSVSYTVHDRT